MTCTRYLQNPRLPLHFSRGGRAVITQFMKNEVKGIENG